MLDESSTLGAETPEPQPEEKGNKTFLIIAAVFAGLIFVTLVCMALYFLVWVPRQAAQPDQEATAEAQRLEQAQAMTATALAAQVTPTFLPTAAPTRTPTTAASPTQVVVIATPLASPEATWTAEALAAAQTQLSGQMTQTAVVAALTASSTTLTPLPATGFFDQVGLPLLAVLAFALLTVIFIARRMRTVSRK